MLDFALFFHVYAGLFVIFVMLLFIFMCSKIFEMISSSTLFALKIVCFVAMLVGLSHVTLLVIAQNQPIFREFQKTFALFLNKAHGVSLFLIRKFAFDSVTFLGNLDQDLHFDQEITP